MAVLTGISDQDLIAGALAGDGEAFGVLVERYERAVYNLCLRMLHNVEDAKDATQEAFFKAYRSLRTFKLGAKFSTRSCLRQSICAIRGVASAPNSIPAYCPSAGSDSVRASRTRSVTFPRFCAQAAAERARNCRRDCMMRASSRLLRSASTARRSIFAFCAASR